MKDTSRRAGSFGQAADAYERGRPTYPEQAVDFLVPTGARDVLDLGAGTGKLARSLLARGLAVTAVDPSVEMLERLRAASPEIPSFVGTAESVPLPAATFDLVTVAQAWHWVDPTRAYSEVARVLRPEGALGLVWNMRDYTPIWMRELSSILDEDAEEIVAKTEPEESALFEPFGRAVIPWKRPMTRPEVVDMVTSRSAYLVSTSEQQATTRARLAAWLDGLPELRTGNFELPYRTVCFRAKRR